MQDKEKNMHLRYKELFAKRQRLADLRNKVIQSRKRNYESRINETGILEVTEQPLTSGFVQRTRNGTLENMLQGFQGIDHSNNGSPDTILAQGNVKCDRNEVNFDDSDDSVRDKDYQPNEDDYSSCSHISDSPDSNVTKRRIAQAKRRLFSTENINDIIPNKICVENAVVHVDQIGDLSNDSNHPTSSFSVTERIFSNEIVCTGNFDDIPCDKAAVISLTTEINNDLPNDTIMAADCNGTVNHYFSESIMENDVLPITPKGKKKICDPMKWKRTAAKFARLKGSPYHSTVAKKKQDMDGRMLKPPCSCKSKCFEKVSYGKRELIFDQFWKQNCNWDQRRQFIVDCVEKKRKRLMKTDGNLETDKRKFSYTYNLSLDGERFKVCRVMFLNTLSIGEKFVKLSLEKRLEGGLVAEDQRGKHVPANKSPEPIVQSVIDHINSYPAYESHYSRQKSERKFLGPDLNIAIMYRHYKELMESKQTPANLVAKDWLYRNIFNVKFNLSFKLPSVDTCDDCDAYERKLKDCLTETEKEEIEKEKEQHDKAAEERYNLKRMDKEEAMASSGKKKVLMFDLQKCLATPNLTNSKSFYLRKLWTLNLTLYDATRNVGINIVWSENISGRGGNEVASCLIRWADESSSQLTSLEELTLWSDNCAGQNRNLMVVVAFMWLLHRLPQLKIINHKFMLKGHTHMEVDQIHSQIERKKKLLKTMQIAIPRDWSQFIRTCGGKRTFEVYDMELHHFKDLTYLYKKDGPLVSRKKNKDGKEFKISECVWLQVKRDQPGVLFYKKTFSEDFKEISLVRNASKGVIFPDDLPQLRQSQKPISTAKYNDLITLLQWIPAEFHTYYKSLKHSNTESDFPNSD